MKSLIVSVIALAGIAVVPVSAHADTVCQKDYLGRVVCTDRQSGYKTTTQRDYLGRDVTTGPGGYRQTCQTDYLGRYVCR